FIGAIIVCIGFYALLWGKAKEDEENPEDPGKEGEIKMARSYWYNEVLPFTVFVAGECTSVCGYKGLEYVVVLYKGPGILSTSSPTEHILLQSSPESDWVLGGLLISGRFILIATWYIIQTQIMKIYPEEITVAFFDSLGVTICSVLGCLAVGTRTWNLGSQVEGIFGSCVSVVIHTWGVRLKGPVYVALFKPLSIAVAAFMSFTFLGDALLLGSVIGAAIISIGFYAVIWGKAKEQECAKRDGMEILPPGSSAISYRNNNRMLPGWDDNIIQSSILQRDELLCLHRLLWCTGHSCSSSFLPLLPQLPSSKASLYSRICLLSLIAYEQPLPGIYLHTGNRFQAKIIGTLVSISGALVVTLYKGPEIISISSAKPTNSFLLQSTTTTNWIIGGLLIATEELLSSTWYIV
ncbi:hypothetical protein Tsubulata_051052, partial [Turnera subulata]